MHSCDKCGSHTFTNSILGTLGRLVYVRCRQCGWDQSIPVSELDEEVEDE